MGAHQSDHGPSPTLSQLGILRALRAGKRLQELSATAGIAAAEVGMEIARLQVTGYLTDDCELTLKALKALER